MHKKLQSVYIQSRSLQENEAPCAAALAEPIELKNKEGGNCIYV